MKHATQMKTRLTGLAVIGISTFAAYTNYAQDSTNGVASAVDVPAQSRLNPPFTVGVEAGTTGFGGAANWRFLPHFGVGTAFDYFSYSLNNKSIQDATYNANLRLQSEPLTLDLYPGRRSSFHVSLGMLFNQDQLSGSATGANLSFDNQNYTGNLNLNIKYQPVDPYLAIGGNLYLDDGHHISLTGTLGVAYFGDANVSLTSNPVDPTGTVAHEVSQVQKYANDLRFYPVIKLGLNFSF
jgi:hypothetical protein